MSRSLAASMLAAAVAAAAAMHAKKHSLSCLSCADFTNRISKTAELARRPAAAS